MAGKSLTPAERAEMRVLVQAHFEAQGRDVSGPEVNAYTALIDVLESGGRVPDDQGDPRRLEEGLRTDMERRLEQA